jgi:hypothetical protein
MSLSYALPRPAAVVAVHSQSPSLEHTDDGVMESIYVFPFPSSAPASPSLSSEFSAPTDMDLSEFSDMRSRDSSTHRGGVILNPGGRGVETGSWDWTTDIVQPSEPGGVTSVVVEGAERMDRWEIVNRRRHASGSLTRSSSHQPHFDSDSAHLRIIRRKRRRRSRAHSLPHPRIHIPLLSVVLSLFSVDDSTLHLLTHTSSHSTLFPGHPSCLESTAADDWDENPPHGVARLASRSEHRTLREGCAVACDPTYVPSNPFIFSPFRLVGLWGLVSGVVVNGGKALREVWG